VIRTMEEPVFFQKYSMVIQYLLIVDDAAEQWNCNERRSKSDRGIGICKLLMT